MMSKTRKNPQLPRVPLTDLDTHIGVTDLDSIYGGAPRQGRAEQDPLAELERQESLDAVQELRDLQKQRKMLEYKRRVEKLKQEVGAEDTSGGGLAIRGMFNFSATDLQAIAGMAPEDRQKFMDTVREINMMSSMGGGGGKVNPIMQLAMMGGFNRTGQQGLTAKDVIELQSSLNQIYQNKGGQDDSLTRTLLMKLLTETVPQWQNQSMQNMKYAYDTQIQALKDNQSDPMRDIKYVKELGGMIGLTPGGQDKEVALAQMQMQDRWKLEEFKFRREELANQKLLGTVKQILENVDIPSIVRSATRQQVGDQFRAQPQAPPQSPALPANTAGVGKTQLMEITCPNPQCKGPDGLPTKIYAPATATQVTCQSCGGTYAVKLGA